MAMGYTRLISLFFLIAFQVFAAGPFGFERGMTKEQVIALVGQRAVEKVEDDQLVLKTAPRPHPDFNTYIVMISPERGLVKFSAVGKIIHTSRYGEEVKSAFDETQNLVIKSYGPPAHAYDLLKSGSIWKEPEDWMAGLAKEERGLLSFWQFTPSIISTNPSPSHLALVELKAHALSMEEGYLVLGYEFEGLVEYLDSKKAKAGEVF